ncbi:hypothetical protein LPJ75_006415, partial [Coemansia sp. RSA 2598]
NISTYQGRRKQLPETVLVVHDKTPTMRILYVSSNVRQVMKYEPADVIGQPSYQYVTGSGKTTFKRTFGSEATSMVLESNVQAYDGEGRFVVFRIIHFNCDNMGFNISISCPDMQPPVTPAIRTLVSKIGVVSACLVLETGGSEGPTILFASRSFSRIVGVDTDEVQGLGFLSLVAPADIVRAGAFLESVFDSNDVMVERLTFVVEGRETSVEVMAAGSREGVMLLCQMKAHGNVAGNEDAGYLSLEEIISSDPETSDCPDMWRPV